MSPFGIMGLGGNVYEWEETSFNLNNSSGSSNRGVRGGSWAIPDGSSSEALSSRRRNTFSPSIEAGDYGFRVASRSSIAVPEPGSLAVLVSAGLMGLAHRRRRASLR